jgi:hypothetical protein
MALVNGRYTPEAITSIRRNTTTQQARIIVKTLIPVNEGDPTVQYSEEDITVGQTVKTRRMVQKANTSNFYEFTFPPTQIAYEGMGVEIQEIPRPLLTPLIDIRGSRNYKAVFEFLVAEQYDGLSSSVEQQLVTLQSFANSAEPVYFENFDTFLTNGYWYIAEFSIKTSRVNTNGEIVAAQCSIGLLEYQSTDTKFAKFPKLDYTSLGSRKKGGGGGGGGGNENNGLETDAKAGTANGVPLGNKDNTTSGQTNASATVAYRWIRTTAPNANDRYKAGWIKRKGKDQWVLYSKTNVFPYSNAFVDLWKASATAVPVAQIDLKGGVKASYEKSIAAVAAVKPATGG